MCANIDSVHVNQQPPMPGGRHDLDPDLDKTKTTIIVLSSNSFTIRRLHYDSLSRGQFR